MDLPGAKPTTDWRINWFRVKRVNEQMSPNYVGVSMPEKWSSGPGRAAIIPFAPRITQNHWLAFLPIIDFAVNSSQFLLPVRLDSTIKMFVSIVYVYRRKECIIKLAASTCTDRFDTFLNPLNLMLPT